MPPLVTTVRRYAVGLTGSQAARVNLDHDLLFARGLHIALPVGGPGDAQPLAALGDGQGALQHPLTLIADHERHLPGFAGGDGAKHEPARMQVESRPLDAGLRHAADEIGQPNVGVGFSHALLGGMGQVHAADGREVFDEGALTQQIAGASPILLTGLGQLIEAAAFLAGGENEFLEQLAGAHSGLPEPQFRPIVVAELHYFRVGSLTARTNERRHTCVSSMEKV